VVAEIKPNEILPIMIVPIRLCTLYNLIFFSFALLSGCRKAPSEITLLWDNQRATGILIPKRLTDGISDSLEHRLLIRLVKAGEPIAMLGNYKIGHDDIIFEPLVPFTRGLHYEVLVNHHVVGEIRIPEPDPGDGPALLAIYPTQDTVPENLLKMYLQFSKPMREGQSLHYIALLKNNRDTVPDVFLDLQPELWDADRTTLTVWLDPGRIKRDLQPNKLLGSPLRKGEHYTLLVSGQWKDIQGSPLRKAYHKNFTVTFRDSLSPDPQTWIISNPKQRHSLEISFKAPLDYSLLTTTLHIVDEKGIAVLGAWHIGEEEKQVTFIPDAAWADGRYLLQIETRLEDLAGNNINRAFDVDVGNQTKEASSAKMVSLPFSVEN
jgi:hypothetical protein